jgi:hypothetical protein
LKERVMGLVRSMARTVRGWGWKAMGPFLPEGLDWPWYVRTRDVMASPDNDFIPRVANAGGFVDGCQVMHNGLRIVPGSYYGKPVGKMLELNKGVHEPQEERAFGEVLQHIPAGGVMLELGAYWSFYSMWFCQVVKEARCFMVEPEGENLEFGKKNFAVNGLSGEFVQGFVGSASRTGGSGTPQIGVDDFLAERGIAHLNILHSDIQGFEMEMLKGAARSLAAKAVDFVFISTHSNDLHRSCVQTLQGHGYRILADADLNDSYSFDGLIVASAPGVAEPAALAISHKRTDKRRKVRMSG